MLTAAEKQDAERCARNGHGTSASLGRLFGGACVALSYIENNDPGMAAYTLRNAIEFTELIDTLEAGCTSSSKQ